MANKKLAVRASDDSVIICPQCDHEMRPLDESLADGEYTVHCLNSECGEEFTVRVKTQPTFTAIS